MTCQQFIILIWGLALIFGGTIAVVKTIRMKAETRMLELRVKLSEQETRRHEIILGLAGIKRMEGR